MRDWIGFVEGSGYEYVDSIGSDLIIHVDGYDFKINKYKFPPKKLSIRQCLTPREYCIDRFTTIHGGYYSYDRFEWVGKVSDYGVFICPEHGEFRQIINNHLRGQGCFECFGSKKLSDEEIINACKSARGDRYDYSKLTYNRSNNCITIVCREHGEISVNLHHHVNGVDCKKCVQDMSVGKFMTNDEFVRKARVVHGDLYDYTMVEYRGAKSKVNIICKDHGVFTQVANYHLSGNGCQVCGLGKSGFGRSGYLDACSKTGSNLYVMRIEGYGELFYKIGISKNVDSRIYGIVRDSGYSVTLILKHHDVAWNIFDLEKHLHRVFRLNRFKPSVKFSGDSECFLDIDIKVVEFEISSWYDSLQ